MEERQSGTSISFLQAPVGSSPPLLTLALSSSSSSPPLSLPPHLPLFLLSFFLPLCPFRCFVWNALPLGRRLPSAIKRVVPFFVCVYIPCFRPYLPSSRSVPRVQRLPVPDLVASCDFLLAFLPFNFLCLGQSGSKQQIMLKCKPLSLYSFPLSSPNLLNLGYLAPSVKILRVSLQYSAVPLNSIFTSLLSSPLLYSLLPC